MKLCPILLTFSVVLACFAALVPAGAAQRCVLMEDFTNAGCGPCAVVNPSLRAMTSSLTHDTLVVVAYHTPGPGDDPMYFYNPTEIDARDNFYVISTVPHVKVDGTYGVTPEVSNIATIRNQIRSRYATPSPCTMDFIAQATGTTGVQVSGTITAEQDMLSSNQRLFVALITDTMLYSSPPGANGEILFPDVFRDMWPSGAGQAFTLAAGQTYNINASLVRMASWDINDLEVVVWVQDFSSHVVHQAGIARLNRNYGMVTESASPRQLIRDMNGGQVLYSVNLTNIGLLDDVYDVNLEGAFPVGWIYSVEAAGVPADPTHIQVFLPSMQTTTLIVRMDPNGHPGSFTFDVHVTTPSEPVLSATETFRLMSGLDLLLVDDDEGANRETWYLNTLAAIGSTLLYGRWDMSLGPLEAGSLTGVDIVMWFTGDGWQDGTTLTAEDQTILSNYLDQGGRLFLTGQGIGGDIGSDPFFTNYIHGVFLQNYPGHFDLVGILNDPISEGINLNISGGSGANNQTRQHTTNPDASGFATPVFLWGTPPGVGGYPALKVDNGTFRIVYFGFGFEAISGEVRNSVMQRTLNWLTPPIVPPAAPANLVVRAAGGNVTLRWDSVEGATGYVVYSADSPEGDYSEELSGTYDGASWTAPISGNTKFYFVTAVQ